MGGSQSRPGVACKEGVGARVHGDAVGVLAGGTWEEGVFADDTGSEGGSEVGLSVTGVDGGGGAVTEGLADD